jgi:hypothetical protein
MISEFIRRCHYRESVSVLVEVDGELEPRELNHNQVSVNIASALRIRIRCCFGSGIRDGEEIRTRDPGSQIIFPKAEKQLFGSKIL